jgi:hypothetical protein
MGVGVGGMVMYLRGMSGIFIVIVLFAGGILRLLEEKQQ